ncbi:MAG: hypothetical protein SPE01_00265 [Candidatus Spyradocola sp.]|nr:hypothetical protein [Candidatus Spyradocola sp.]
MAGTNWLKAKGPGAAGDGVSVKLCPNRFPETGPDDDLQEKGVRKRIVRGKGACVERDGDPGRHGAAGFSSVAGGRFCPDRIRIL